VRIESYQNFSGIGMNTVDVHVFMNTTHSSANTITASSYQLTDDRSLCLVL